MDERVAPSPGDGQSNRRLWPVALALLALAAAIVAVFAFWVASSRGDPGIADTLVYERVDGSGEIIAFTTVLEKRLEGTGAIVRADGGRIAIDIPVAADRETIRDVASPLGRVALVPLGDHAAVDGEVIDPATFPELMGGDLIRAAPSPDESGNALLLRLDPSVAGLFAEYTRQHVGEYVALTLDGAVLSAPMIQDVIPSGEVLIRSGTPGGFASAELDRLVRIMNGGPLPSAIRAATD